MALRFQVCMHRIDRLILMSDVEWQRTMSDAAIAVRGGSRCEGPLQRRVFSRKPETNLQKTEFASIHLPGQNLLFLDPSQRLQNSSPAAAKTFPIFSPPFITQQLQRKRPSERITE